MSYRTLARRADHEDVVQNSRFLATVAPVRSVAEAAQLLEEVRALHPDASHHCWAYRVAADQRFSDDGEPGGTAGRPMLEVLLKRDLDRVAAVVVRYFGGRKLGAGGLARAYGGAVARAVRAAGERGVEPETTAVVRAPFAQVDVLLRALDAVPEVARSAPEYDAYGVRLQVRMPARVFEALERRLAELTRGDAGFDQVRYHEDPEP